MSDPWEVLFSRHTKGLAIGGGEVCLDCKWSWPCPPFAALTTLREQVERQEAALRQVASYAPCPCSEDAIAALATRCPSCGSDGPIVVDDVTDLPFKCRDPWHGEPSERCPTCGAVHPDDEASSAGPCADPWHARGRMRGRVEEAT